MRAVLYSILFAIMALAVYVTAITLPLAGAFDKYETKLADQCRRLDVAPGTEDIAIDHAANVAFISAADRRAWFNEGGAQRSGAQQGGAVKGGIYLLDLTDPTTGPTEALRVSPDGMRDFLPHGVSLWRGDNGERRLFVVNHPSSGEEIVEIFSINADHRLTHLESISFSAMTSPNDVVAVGPRQFYASNDRRHDEGLMALLETYLALPLASLVYYDGAEGDFARKGLVYANGVNVSPDGAELYVAEVLKRRLQVFDREPETGVLTHKTTIKLNTAPDNIDVDKDGALWIGGHPQALKFSSHAKDPSKISPSHVVRVDLQSGAVEDVFIALDGEINASSVGAAHNNLLLVGAVFDGHIMVCPL